jgi:hypothetical protein
MAPPQKIGNEGAGTDPRPREKCDGTTESRLEWWMNLKGKAENLRPFQPGKSGNPGGRPRKRPISERYAEVAEAELPKAWRKELGLRRGATYGDAVAMGQVRAAIRGRTDAAREVREAIEGKATQRIEITETTGVEIVTDNLGLESEGI